jgi:branched-chain amino acid transport system permease protein
MTFESILQLFLNGISESFILMLATMGIVIIFKTSYTTNFSQGMIATFAAFVVASIVPFFIHLIPGIQTITALILSIIVAVIVAFGMGLFIDTMILRKAKMINSGGKQIITMGLVLIFSGTIPLIFGVLPMSIPFLADTVTPKEFFIFGMRLSMSYHNYYASIIAFVVLLIVFLSLRFTKWGLGVRATASNEIVSNMMGVNTRLITAMSWAIAGGLGALAATLYAPNAGNLTPGLMNTVQVDAFLASVLGGFTSFYGPLVGAILLPLTNIFIKYFYGLWSKVIVYTLLLIVVLIKPIGLFGKRIAKKV